MNFIKNISNTYKYIFFLILISLSSLLFSLLFINKFPNIIDNQNNMIFENITFGHGPLIFNLINHWEYSSKFLNQIDFVLQNLPILPLLIFAISKLTTNFYLIIIIKNIILFTVIFWTIIFYLQSLNKNCNYLFVFLAIFLIPYNLFVSLNFEYSDNLVAILLPCLFLILLSNLNQKYLLSSVILFILYLTKTSMFFICTGLPLIILVLENKEKFKSKKYMILIGPLIAMIIWGIFSYAKTNRLAFGTNSLTVSSMGLTIATHKNFFEYYPEKSIDLLLRKIEIPKSIKNEWEFYDYFKKKNKEYLSDKENLINYIKSCFKKIPIILFYVKRDSSFPDADGNYDNKIRYSLIFDKLFINISILVFVFNIILQLKNKKNCRDDLIFIFTLNLALLPLIAGWATAKHLVPISILCYFYLIHRFFIFEIKK